MPKNSTFRRISEAQVMKDVAKDTIVKIPSIVYSTTTTGSLSSLIKCPCGASTWANAVLWEEVGYVLCSGCHRELSYTALNKI